MTILILGRFHITAHISRSFSLQVWWVETESKVCGTVHKHMCTTIFILMPTKFGTKFIVFYCHYVHFKIFEVVLGYTYYMWELRV